VLWLEEIEVAPWITFGESTKCSLSLGPVSLTPGCFEVQEEKQWRDQCEHRYVELAHQEAEECQYGCHANHGHTVQ